MRYFLFVFFLLAGCQQLMRGQVEQVRLVNAKDKIMQINCSGPAGAWSDCYNAANSSCSGGFNVIERKENIPAALRQITFQCR